MLLFHLCYASGNSEPGRNDPSLATAKQRVDNYASAFLRAGAAAVIANGHSHDPYYIDALFTTNQTLDAYWRGAPDFHDRAVSYASSRTPGATYQMDPESAGKYYRSVTGNLDAHDRRRDRRAVRAAAHPGPDPRTHAGAVTPAASGASGVLHRTRPHRGTPHRTAPDPPVLVPAGPWGTGRGGHAGLP